MMKDVFNWLVSEYQENNIELHLLSNGVDYDTNFHYNCSTDILSAESSKIVGESFGSDGVTLTQHVQLGNIEIKVKFL